VVLVARNVSWNHRVGKNVRVVWEESASKVWQAPEKSNSQSSMAASRDGYFVHAQIGQRVSHPSDRHGISTGWAEITPQTHAILAKEADICYEDAICQLGTTQSVVVARGPENEEWANLHLKCYSIQKITVTAQHTAANGVIEWSHRLIADALSKLMACSDVPKELWIDPPPAVVWADRITIRCSTRHWRCPLIFGQDVVHPIALQNTTWYTTNYTQGIDNTVSQLAARARQLQQRRDDMDPAMQNLNLSRYTSKWYFDHTANLQAEDHQIGVMAFKQ